jgi:hypothetical protein
VFREALNFIVVFWEMTLSLVSGFGRFGVDNVFKFKLFLDLNRGRERSSDYHPSYIFSITAVKTKILAVSD